MHQQERGGWVVVNPDEDDDEPEEDDQEIKDKTLPRWQIWLAAERSRDQRHWRPWRPDKTKKQTEEDCEDPERQARTLRPGRLDSRRQEGLAVGSVLDTWHQHILRKKKLAFAEHLWRARHFTRVLFDDIGQSLIRLSSQDLQFQLVQAFLQFLGVPSGFSPPASCLYLAMDENSIFDNGLYDEKPLTFFNPLFSGASCVGRMDRLGCPRWTRGQNREGEEFIRNVFHLVMPLFSGKEKSQLCFSWLQYEIGKVVWCLHTKNKKRLKSQGKNCKKLAKNLLKEPENRNNFCLWKQYAHLEWLLGNTEDARKVFDTALGTAGSQGLKDSELCELSLLYAKLEVELEVELSPEVRGAASARAVHILTKLTESSPYGPYTGQVLAVHILKARKAYEHALQDCLGDSCVSDPAPTDSCTRLISLAKCFMLFQYLTVGIGAAVRIYEQVFAKLHSSVFPEGSGEGNSASFQSRSSFLEAITLMHTSLLRFHMKVSVYPLAPLREALSQALKLYPGNQVLWRSYVQIQNKSHSASKTRRFFDTITRSAKPLEPWLFAIEAEKMRKRLVETVQRLDGREIHATIPETGLTHRIQALFENAMRSDSGSQCPLLWRMYLNFLKVQVSSSPCLGELEALFHSHLLGIGGSLRNPDGIMSHLSGLGKRVQVTLRQSEGKGTHKAMSQNMESWTEATHGHHQAFTWSRALPYLRTVRASPAPREASQLLTLCMVETASQQSSLVRAWMLRPGHLAGQGRHPLELSSEGGGRWKHRDFSSTACLCPLLAAQPAACGAARVSLGNKERSKGVFYKALQNCPWAKLPEDSLPGLPPANIFLACPRGIGDAQLKDAIYCPKVLYLDAVEYFPEEMQEVLDLMTEKELRVRLPLEELELLLED
ncbi:Protein nrde2 [Saguinus oedipus]|uniref:Protein nrde2 n=1 Tax=Saguinus oedipus TaxID=9490 RepID=A0ABQ9V5E7_SAGOE|nr:Protein nrde2 [Saguinus oedipus]